MCSNKAPICTTWHLVYLGWDSFPKQVQHLHLYILRHIFLGRVYLQKLSTSFAKNKESPSLKWFFFGGGDSEEIGGNLNC